METRYKVCLVVPSLKAGGMERVMSTFANFLATKSFIETHIVLLGNSSIFYNLSEDIIVHNPKVISTNGSKLILTIKLFGYLRGKIKEIRPTTILSFGETYNSFVLLSLIGLKKSIFISDRSKISKDWGILHNFLRKWLYRLSSGIIAQTKYAKSYLFDITRHNNIRVIPNPVKADRTLRDRENVILTVGRLIGTKKIDELIDIFSDLSLEDWQLWIVGDGPKIEELKFQAKKLNVEKQVKFWGYQKNVKEFYEKSKLFAFTSYSEGFPNVILEAMVAGLPIIGYDCESGPSDMVLNGKNGFLVKLGDKNDFKNKLSTLVRDNEVREYCSKKSIEISKSYDTNVICERYLKFILPL